MGQLYIHNGTSNLFVFQINIFLRLFSSMHMCIGVSCVQVDDDNNNNNSNSNNNNNNNNNNNDNNHTLLNSF